MYIVACTHVQCKSVSDVHYLAASTTNQRQEGEHVELLITNSIGRKLSSHVLKRKKEGATHITTTPSASLCGSQETYTLYRASLTGWPSVTVLLFSDFLQEQAFTTDIKQLQ